jgi:hypothetical protein
VFNALLEDDVVLLKVLSLAGGAWVDDIESALQRLFTQ